MASSLKSAQDSEPEAPQKPPRRASVSSGRSDNEASPAVAADPPERPESPPPPALGAKRKDSFRKMTARPANEAEDTANDLSGKKHFELLFVLPLN